MVITIHWLGNDGCSAVWMNGVLINVVSIIRYMLYRWMCAGARMNVSIS